MGERKKNIKNIDGRALMKPDLSGQTNVLKIFLCCLWSLGAWAHCLKSDASNRLVKSLFLLNLLLERASEKL